MLKLLSMDAAVRVKMLAEVDADIASGNLSGSKRFNDNGRRLYPGMLREAIQAHDDEWLASRLHSLECFNATERKKGGANIAKVPRTAPQTLAEGEFNCFYLRGLCVVAEDRSIQSLVIYRARESENPRDESEMMIGTMIDAKSLLADLRAHHGVDKSLRLPPGPNSGLSAKLP